MLYSTIISLLLGATAIAAPVPAADLEKKSVMEPVIEMRVSLLPSTPTSVPY
jgi:hypothetical protein